jgi:HK97 family phage portal protein
MGNSFYDKVNNFLLGKSNKIQGQVRIPPSPITGGNGDMNLAGVFPQQQDGRPQYHHWSFKRACQDGFESSTWVYACITTWMSQVASIPWIVREKGKDGKWAQTKDHPIEAFLKNPNPFMSGGDLMERLTSDLFIGGNAVWKKVYDGRGKLTAVWPLDQDKVLPVPDRVNFLARYIIREGAIDTPMNVDECVHFMLQNPSDIFWGISPLKCIARVLDCDLEALQWWINAVYSGCRKDGVLSFKHNLTPQQYEQTIKIIRDQFTSNIGGRFPIVLGHEAQYTPYDLSPAELDFTESRKMTREEIAAAFKVPPPLIGILDHSTYNNLTTARRIFWVDAVIPFLERIKNTLNRTLLQDFIAPSKMGTFRIDFDISRVEALADDFSKKLEQAVLMMGMSIPFDMIDDRLELDIGSFEGSDKSYILSNYVPLSQVEAIAKKAAEPTPAPVHMSPPAAAGGAAPPLKIEGDSAEITARPLKAPTTGSAKEAKASPLLASQKEREQFSLLFSGLREHLESLN